MTLGQVKKDQGLTITRIPDEIVRAQVIRFGISEGSQVVCVETIPGGPIVIRKNRHEIAIGRSLAQSIEIELVGSVKDIPNREPHLQVVGERG